MFVSVLVFFTMKMYTCGLYLQMYCTELYYSLPPLYILWADKWVNVHVADQVVFLLLCIQAVLTNLMLLFFDVLDLHSCYFVFVHCVLYIERLKQWGYWLIFLFTPNAIYIQNSFCPEDKVTVFVPKQSISYLQRRLP